MAALVTSAGCSAPPAPVVLSADLEGAPGPRAQLSPTSSPSPPAGPATKATDAAASNAYAGYFFVLPADRREHLAEQLAVLQPHDEVSRVVELLGKPDGDYKGATKDVLPRWHRARYLKYVVARFKEGLVNTRHDQVITLWFDFEGRLEAIDSSYPPVQSMVSTQVSEPFPRQLESGWGRLFSGVLNCVAVAACGARKLV